ncbi:unnamed protein product [Acanthoscelides obtectus]|uniref:Hexosyltransferase n=1 Tax=Acanthoscelides obtectus TaxID=200917 RepID=A0A9P0P1A1_ACAOB|nr:unnamed protein product [Acanthoscelides obtectus]CAK1676682.1 Acetylgalactosaminyl-O-glycosyl-glycoprotein beta-1,3-N-acetylglucosaminyltransferase [Acanthoscelides obtectus]
MYEILGSYPVMQCTWQCVTYSVTQFLKDQFDSSRSNCLIKCIATVGPLRFITNVNRARSQTLFMMAIICKKCPMWSNRLKLYKLRYAYFFFFFSIGVTLVFMLRSYIEISSVYAKEDLQPCPFTHSSSNQDQRKDNSDYHKLLDIYFKYKHLPESCIASDRYLVAVHTSPEHIENRNVIRSTWGQRSFGIKVFFLLANTTDELLQKKISSEASEFKDVVQADFVDSYCNITYKHVLALKFAIDKCSNIKYLVKVDDDTFVNTPNLKQFLDLYDRKYSNNSNILCLSREKSPVMRSGKWKVSEEMYPGKYYIKHCFGFFIIYPKAAVTAIYREAQKEDVKLFWIDDIFVSGVLAGKAGINHTSITNLWTDYGTLDKYQRDFRKFGGRPFLVGAMEMSTVYMQELWIYLKDHLPKTNIVEMIEQ